MNILIVIIFVALVIFIFEQRSQSIVFDVDMELRETN